MIGTLALALALAVACKDYDDDGIAPSPGDQFTATLNGANERPTPVTTGASGTATFDVAGGTVAYQIEVDDIAGVTEAHIHLGAANVAGPVLVPLFEEPPPGTDTLDQAVLVDSSFTAAAIQAISGSPVISLDSLLVLMGNGNAYANVHTVANPAGEIRGQIEED